MTAFPVKRPGKPAPASERAASWVLLQEEGPLSESSQRRFADWLAESETHVQGYEDALWALDAVARHAAEPELLVLRGAALSARGDRRRLWGLTSVSGLAAAAVAGFALWHAMPKDEPPPVGIATLSAARTTDGRAGSYVTGIGERSAIQLPDGSVATLDTDSQMRVAYTNRERGVFLLKGQALFEVAHGKNMPFQVYAKGQRITAVGTVFNVRIEGAQVRVSMVEGTVRVRSLVKTGNPNQLTKELTLTAGEALVAEPAKPMTVASIDRQQVASWKGGLLIFNDTPLASAVAEINRYSTRPIAIADTSIGNLRVSGVFKSNDLEHFSGAMAEVLPIAVTHAPDGAPIIRARADQ